MTDQLAAAEYSAEPADLFVQLYDAIPDDVFEGWAATRWYAAERVRREANEIADSVLATGTFDPARTAGIVDARGDRGRFVILLGLDIALAHASPYGPYHDAPALAGVLVTYLTEGKLNGPRTTGALLPRCAFAGRPRGLRTKAEFFGVHRVPAAEWARIDHRVLPAVNDPHLNRDEPVAVGCAPVLETYDDIEIEFEERAGLTVYRLRPMDTSGIRSRVKAIIRRLDESGAQLAVMPEASLSDSLLELWKEVAFDTAARDRARRPLRFLLLGTGPIGGGDPPPNRAVLLDRWTGQELLVQDKLSGFTLDADQMRLWRLPDAPSTGSAVEYARPGRKVSVLDSSLGRLAVLICEDLARSVDWERELRSAGVSHLLVPIFSKPILEFRWEQRSAERQVIELGTWVTVSNSLAVGAAIPDDEPRVPGPRYTCLVTGPKSLDRVAYQTEGQFGVARTGAELGRLPTSELPRVFPGAAYDAWFDHWHDDKR
ncbi:hypothetical protein [Actinomadura decatromicini]|uniref:CN hydrolase domain-containing protein n=1 Tax=Actinomadura decatromicini TaxID=2604572 RepID=A0A5D3FW62_9ACTN|nr:hypothetical protein [Actinomadura decatromicini]TYK52292.1 hypothetical protein FXF68_00340 [Actinomadura decatromicini]